MMQCSKCRKHIEFWPSNWTKSSYFVEDNFFSRCNSCFVVIATHFVFRPLKVHLCTLVFTFSCHKLSTSWLVGHWPISLWNLPADCDFALQPRDWPRRRLFIIKPYALLHLVFAMLSAAVVSRRSLHKFSHASLLTFLFHCCFPLFN